eukprot:CAMPEP_0115532530 /NCGR_PEP_ID=MMETSP0271-20121206/85626_1 /TAXON_ID=71861 /ORGANISM="Scrippsiella trochoidea, Strain CCMP3099" /LENGTH=44 /DNA_ID= /DNA_START= /DNA_END= /DNA_ORIENTATION=
MGAMRCHRPRSQSDHLDESVVIVGQYAAGQQLAIEWPAEERLVS